MGPPRRVRAFVWRVVAVAAVASLWTLVQAQSYPTRSDLVVAGLFAVMIGLARTFPVQVGPRFQISVDNAAAFAAVLVLPPYLAVIAVFLGVAAAGVVRPSTFIQQAFNASVAVLAVAAASSFADTILSGTAANANTLRLVVAALLAALTMWTINTVLVDSVIALQQRRRLFERWWAVNRHGLWQGISLYLLGLLMVVSPADHTWALALLLVPTAVVYRSLRDGVALQYQTRMALEELADVVDLRDRYTHDHCRRVADLSRLLARKLGSAPEEVERIYLAARVHDVGKIGIKSTVLMKPGGLNDAEWVEMRSHPEVGARLVAKFPEFRHGRELILSHHERWDGKGYPRGLKAEAIPFGARVIAVTDTWDAMTSNRSYRKAMDLHVAMIEIEQGKGSQFDPRIAEAFLGLLHEQPELKRQHTDTSQDIDVAEPLVLASAGVHGHSCC